MTKYFIEPWKKYNWNNKVIDNIKETIKYFLYGGCLVLKYNNKNKDRNYSNSYYKKIFDKDNLMNDSKFTKLKNKWKELTFFSKFIIGLIGFIGSIASIYSVFLTSSSSNNVNRYIL